MKMNDFHRVYYVSLGVAAVAGWCVIEFILWLFSFVTISFGGQ